jgi:hypothetical protein
MGLSHSPKIVTDNLVLCLDAANRKSYSGSGNTWFDLSGNNRYGNILNGPTFTNDTSQCFSFDGSNDMITINNGGSLAWLPDGSLGLSQFTIDMWVKSSDTSGVLYTKPWNGNGQYNIFVYSNSLYVSTGSGSSTISFGRQVSNGTWTNIVCWANGTQIGYYINYNQHSGNQNHGLLSTIPSSGNADITTGLMTLYPYGDGWVGNTSFSILGLLAVCKVYNRTLTAQEIQQNFNALRGRFGI